MKEQNDYNVRAVERALQILNSFDEAHPERGVSEIAEVVGLHKATAHRILATLLKYDYVERSDDGQKYRLGIQLVGLGFKVTRRMDLRRESLPLLTRLAELLDEAVDLSILEQNQALYIETIQSRHALTIAAAVGRRLPLHCTASGKIFLAWMPGVELSKILETGLQAYTKNTITDPLVLARQLETVRKVGYAVDDEEFEEGVRAVSTPIHSQLGVVLAAASVPGPFSRITPERIPEIAAALKTTTALISRRLGWPG
jgi:IclR family transcriptional regulator, KDG regulon repressor